MYLLLIIIVSGFGGCGFEVMDRERGHPADHGALLDLSLNNGGVDVSFLKGFDRFRLLIPLQTLVQTVPSEALVVTVKVNHFKNQAQSWSFRDIYLLFSPAPLYHLLLRVALDHCNHQADHLPDLVQHEALTSHVYHCKLAVVADERFSTGHLCDVPAGARVTRSFLGGEVMEVMSPFVKGKESVHPLKSLCLQAKGCYVSHVIVLLRKGHSREHIGVGSSIAVVFGVETLGHTFKPC